MNRPLILVTNDDGIAAPGIRNLIEVAPHSPQSGMGHAITIADPIRLKPVDIYPGILAYECSGTPVDCVKLAKNVLLKDRNIDLCVSGINHGSNAAINIIYSGTLSAAMEASLEKIPSIGFSLLDYAHDADFSPSLPYVKQIMTYVLANGIEEGSLLNVNIPDLPFEEIKGMRVCRQADARWVEEFLEAKDPRGQPYYWLTGKFVNDDDDKDDTDVWALDNGYISVVPSMHDLTNYRAVKEMKRMEELSVRI